MRCQGDVKSSLNQVEGPLGVVCGGGSQKCDRFGVFGVFLAYSIHEFLHPLVVHRSSSRALAFVTAIITGGYVAINLSKLNVLRYCG